MSNGTRTAIVAWLVTATYYFYQYTLRSAPAVMMPQLSEAFGLTAMGVASMVGLFYYGYSPFSLVAGAAMDGLGPRKVIPIGAAAVGVGSLLFATGNNDLASIGRLMQGAGGVFALVGAAYIAMTNFPASRAATLIGATQMFGMAGGSAGQFLVGPLIGSGVHWSTFWVGMGIAGLAISVLLYVLLPSPAAAPAPAARTHDWIGVAWRALGIVFRNPQSILCGVIAGLMFIPTTILDMVWGVRYLQEARGYDYGDVIKEANPPEMSGTATGVINFLNFTFSALLGPVFGRMLTRVAGGAVEMDLGHYQAAFKPMLYGVVLATVLTLLLKETGPAVRRQASSGRARSTPGPPG